MQAKRHAPNPNPTQLNTNLLVKHKKIVFYIPRSHKENPSNIFTISYQNYQNYAVIKINV